jgi:hypothetical protein
VFLELVEDLFYGNGVENVLGSCGEDGEDGKCAVFLILFKTAAEAVVN